MNAKESELALASEDSRKGRQAAELRGFVKERLRGKPGFNPALDRLGKDDLDALRSFLSRQRRSDAEAVMREAREVYSLRSRFVSPEAFRKSARRHERAARYMESCESRPREEIGPMLVERDLGCMRMNVRLAEMTDRGARAMLSSGFRWSPFMQCWTRRLTEESEGALGKAMSVMGGK